MRSERRAQGRAATAGVVCLLSTLSGLRSREQPQDPYGYPEREPELASTDAPYPYAELKVRGNVGLKDVPLVIYPKRLRSVEPALDELGFAGARLAVDWRGPLHAKAVEREDEAERRRFVATVTAAMLEWAIAHKRVARLVR